MFRLGRLSVAAPLPFALVFFTTLTSPGTARADEVNPAETRADAPASGAAPDAGTDAAQAVADEAKASTPPASAPAPAETPPAAQVRAIPLAGPTGGGVQPEDGEGAALSSDDDALDLSLTQLLDMSLTTGSFLEVDLRNAAATLTVIEQKQIRSSGARTLGELCEIFVPGFQVMLNKWNGEIWGVRGVASDRNTKIIFLVNGLKLNHESRDGAYSEITLGLLGDIERVEVLRGPAGLVYGSGAIAAVVNVVTRRVAEGGGEVRVSTGRWGSRSVEGMVGHRMRNGTAVALSFGLRRSDGIPRTATRIFGAQSWPTPADPEGNPAPSADGWPTDGPVWNTPGNVRASMDITYRDFRLYSRITHEEYGVGGLFPLDAFPDIVGVPPMGTPPRSGGGVVTGPTSPLATTDSFGNSRRHQIVDNVSLRATYTPAIGPDKLNIEGAAIGVTNRIAIEPRAGYAGVGGVDSTMGERRYLLGASYLLRRIPRLRSAVGFRYRVDDFGPDLMGYNFHGGVLTRPEITGVVYQSVALYTENQYQLTPRLKATAGLRADRHTRTGMVLSPMVGLLYSPNRDHVIKAVLQGSSNNGSVESYEYNWRHFDSTGTVLTRAHLDNPADPNTSVVPAVTTADLHSLRPERALGVELSSVNRIGGVLTLLPSASYTHISNLFSWNQSLYRVINAGEYKLISLELDAHLDLRRLGLNVGASHAYQRPVGGVPAPVTFTLPAVTQPVQGPDGNYTIEEIPGQTRQVVVDAIRDQITRDGRNFLNLSTQVTKLFVSYSPRPWATLTTSLRVFWGLPGRRDLYAADEALGHNYLGVQYRAIVKWNVGASFTLRDGLVLGVHGYDLLGSWDRRSAVRWQQMGEPVQKQLYVVSLPSWIVSLEKAF